MVSGKDYMGYRMGKLSEDATGIQTRHANGHLHKVSLGVPNNDITVEIRKFQHHDARLKLLGALSFQIKADCS